MSRTIEISEIAEAVDPVALCVRDGLLSSPRTLPPWLFYDAAGSALFERITKLPEYYLTRTERQIFEQYANEIVAQMRSPVTVVELGAGTAAKTGILLRAAVARQGPVLYQPIDVSESALEEAQRNIEAGIPEVEVQPLVANYVTTRIDFARSPDEAVLALYIGSSIGNFAPDEAHEVLCNLRAQMRAGDGLLLGTDLAPGAAKSVAALVAAYDDVAGVTAAFNLNLLVRLNRELGTDFDLKSFRHRARWNEQESRIEMHLESLRRQSVCMPENSAGRACSLDFAAGETIHTENSYKFSRESIGAMLDRAGFRVDKLFEDRKQKFAVTLAKVL